VWDTETYRRLVDAGCEGLVVYQETYDRDTYASVHLKGKKRNYDWRLAALDRGADAGMRRLGLGALLGLHRDWRVEALAMAVDARIAGVARRPAAPRRHPDVGRFAHRARRLRGDERRRAPVRGQRHALAGRGGGHLEGRRLRPRVDRHHRPKALQRVDVGEVGADRGPHDLARIH